MDSCINLDEQEKMIEIELVIIRMFPEFLLLLPIGIIKNKLKDGTINLDSLQNSKEMDINRKLLNSNIPKETPQYGQKFIINFMTKISQILYIVISQTKVRTISHIVN